jgi:hypothetical protein
MPSAMERYDAPDREPATGALRPSTRRAVSAVIGSMQTHEPISLHPDNPHYFLFRGKPTLLITSAEHYGAVINLDFDYIRYLDRLAEARLNYTRIYPGSLIEREGDFCPGNMMAPRPGRLVLPWARSDRAGYELGGNKFDLDRWDDAYFARLDDFLRRCSERDIVVEICFFNCQYPKNWSAQALHQNGNTQGVGSCDHLGFQTLRDKPLVERQVAYVQKLTRAVANYDNAILEICDEPRLFGTPEPEYHEWISYLIEKVREAESGLRHPHLVAQQMDCDLDGPGDFSGDPRVGVIVGQYIWYPTPKQIGGMQLLDTQYHHEKVIELNETAYYPFWYTGDREAASRVEAWEFVVGGGAGFNHLNGSFTVYNPDAKGDANNDKVLASLTHLRAFMESFDFVKMRRDTTTVLAGVPVDAFARCLSEPGRQYAFYIHHSVVREPRYVVRPGVYQESYVLDLPPADYTVEWVDPEQGHLVRREQIGRSGRHVVLATPPYVVDLALRIRRKG